MFTKEIKLAKLAVQNAGLPDVDEKHLEEQFRLSTELDHVFLKTRGDSILWGIISPLLFNPEVLIGKELFWYSETPSANSVKLVKEFEKWCKDRGATEIYMESLTSSKDKVGKLYERLGYNPGGNVYRKVVI